jgi:hypothetical protein
MPTRPVLLLVLLTSCAGGRGADPAAGTPAAEGRSTAPSQTARPALEYRLALEVEMEHGCSLSHESRGESGELVLEVDDKDRATLTLQLEGSTVFGPSFSEFQKGDHDFSTTTTCSRSVWTGTAKRASRRLTATFDTVRTSKDEVPGYGAELPPPQTLPSSLILACSEGTVPVYDAKRPSEPFWDVEGEKPQDRQVLLCKPSEQILGWLHHMVLVDEAIPLAETPGLALQSSTFYFSDRLIIRLAGPS